VQTAKAKAKAKSDLEERPRRAPTGGRRRD
jgi:hypothetical protein